MTEINIINHLEKELEFLLKAGVSNDGEDLWTSRAGPALQKFINAKGKINIEALRNFRRYTIF